MRTLVSSLFLGLSLATFTLAQQQVPTPTRQRWRILRDCEHKRDGHDQAAGNCVQN